MWVKQKRLQGFKRVPAQNDVVRRVASDRGGPCDGRFGLCLTKDEGVFSHLGPFRRMPDDTRASRRTVALVLTMAP